MKRVALAVLPLLWTLLFGIPAFFAAGFAVEVLYDVPLNAESFRFERPGAAWLLLAVPLLLAAHYAKRHARPRIQLSRGMTLATLKPGWRLWLQGSTVGLRASALGLLVFALMGPQSIHGRQRSETEGIDIVLAMDVSLSMEAADIRPNRFDATKSVVLDFVQRRPDDRIGAVVFGRDAYTLLPLTTDKQALRTVIDELELRLVDGRGTAIGNAVGTSLNRLRSSEAASKVVILLTDGDSNAGNISPQQAAELASTMGVKVFAILMGERDAAPTQQGVGIFGTPIFGQTRSFPVNAELLQEMATTTGGEFFEVADRGALERSFHRILDELEKSEIEDTGRIYGELFGAFLWPAMLLLLLELLIRLAVLRRWP